MALSLVLAALVVLFEASAGACVPAPQATRKACTRMQRSCPQLEFVGSSCPGKSDGGCRVATSSAPYCGFQCKARCAANKQCAWSASQCVAGCGTNVVLERGFPDKKTDISIQPVGWVNTGVGDFIGLPAGFSFCGVLIYVTTLATAALPSLFSQLLVRLYAANETDIAKSLFAATLKLDNATALNALAPLPLYALRFKSASPLSPALPDAAAAYRVLFSFPRIKRVAAAVFARNVNVNADPVDVDSPCAFEWQQGAPMDACKAFQTDVPRKLLYAMYR